MSPRGGWIGATTNLNFSCLKTWATSVHRSNQWWWPIRPVTDYASQEAPVRPLPCTGRTGVAQSTCENSFNVTTPSEIIPCYRLNHSIWSLSDNKESSRWVLPGLHPVNHLKTQRGSNVCIKTPTKESPECLTNYIKFPVGSIITNHSSWHEGKWFRVY
jgi:hypothetical protein